MKTSKKGIDLIKSFEGLVLRAYRCPSDVWTIGYGHTGPDVYPTMQITEARAEDLLRQDLARFETGVLALVKVPLTQNQFDALVSFAYNVGLAALSTSTLLKYLNQNKRQLAASEFLRWNKSKGVVLGGLVRRRKAERDLFLTE